jgi:ABC-type nitrate/sulfonate/bicarbonate transport system substrate-binding protein
MPYCIAREKGFYADEGLKVDFILMQQSAAMAATVSGEIEFNGFSSSSIAAAMQGMPIKVVLVLSKKPKYWIFSRPEIRSMSGLVGRTLAVGNRGGSQHIQTLLLLNKFGLNNKVLVMPMLGLAGRSVVESLVSNQIDAGYSSDSTYLELKDKGFLELVKYADHLEEVSAGIGTSHKMIESKPELVQSFVNASYRGMLFFKNNAQESINVMVRYMRLNRTAAARIYDLVIDTFGGEGTITYDLVKRQLQARKEILNLTTPVPTYEQVFDDRFVRQIPKQTGGGIVQR